MDSQQKQWEYVYVPAHGRVPVHPLDGPRPKKNEERRLNNIEAESRKLPARASLTKFKKNVQPTKPSQVSSKLAPQFISDDESEMDEPEPLDGWVRPTKRQKTSDKAEEPHRSLRDLQRDEEFQRRITKISGVINCPLNVRNVGTGNRDVSMISVVNRPATTAGTAEDKPKSDAFVRLDRPLNNSRDMNILGSTKMSSQATLMTHGPSRLASSSTQPVSSPRAPSAQRTSTQSAQRSPTSTPTSASEAHTLHTTISQDRAAVDIAPTQDTPDSSGPAGRDAPGNRVSASALKQLLELRKSALEVLTEEQLPEALRVDNVRKLLERAAADIMGAEDSA